MSKNSKKPEVDTKAAIGALEYILAAGYIDKKKLYFDNFMRGLFFGIGSVIGLAVVATLLLWGLSYFDNVPFIKQISNNIEQTLQK